METRTITEVRIAAEPARVWTALREPSEIRRWFGWEHAGLDAEIGFIFGSDCQVLAEGQSLKFSGVGTTFTLEAHSGGSLLRVTKSEPQLGYDEIEEGFTSFLQQLRFALEQHPGRDRTTLFLPTPARTPIERARAQRGRPTFGSFASLAALEVGAAYELSAAEPLRGEIWFRTAHQLGLTFDEGRALLILARQPEQAHGTAIVTFYEAGDWAPRRERWLTWWKSECA